VVSFLGLKFVQTFVILVLLETAEKTIYKNVDTPQNKFLMLIGFDCIERKCHFVPTSRARRKPPVVEKVPMVASSFGGSAERGIKFKPLLVYYLENTRTLKLYTCTKTRLIVVWPYS
jgi:hypothetical protein